MTRGQRRSVEEPARPDGTSRAGTSPDLDGLVRDLRFDFRSVKDSFNRTVLIEWLRFRTEWVDACIRSAFYVCLFGFFLVSTLAASALMVIGMRDALGNLGGALAILAILAGGGLAFRFHLWTKGVRRARQSLDDREPGGNNGS